MKHQLSALLCLTLLFTASARARLPIISDPLAAYFHYLVSEHRQALAPQPNVQQGSIQCLVTVIKPDKSTELRIATVGGNLERLISDESEL
jgi:hypothetical protein